MRREGTVVTFEDKCAKAAGYRNPAVAQAALARLAKDVQTYGFGRTPLALQTDAAGTVSVRGIGLGSISVRNFASR